MARRFLDDLRTEVSNRMPDNDIGSIDAADVRNPIQDVIDSTVQDEAGFSGDSALSAVTIGTAWVTLNDALFPGETFYDVTVGGDGVFLIPDQVGGTVTGASTAGFSYRGLSAITLDAPTNIVIECAIGENGVPGFDVQSIVGTSGVRNQTMNPSRYVVSAPSSGVYSMMLRAPAGNATVNIANRTFGMIILPTNNP